MPDLTFSEEDGAEIIRSNTAEDQFWRENDRVDAEPDPDPVADWAAAIEAEDLDLLLEAGTALMMAYLDARKGIHSVPFASKLTLTFDPAGTDGRIIEYRVIPR